jgi:hypothetical protein
VHNNEEMQLANTDKEIETEAKEEGVENVDVTMEEEEDIDVPMEENADDEEEEEKERVVSDFIVYKINFLNQKLREYTTSEVTHCSRVSTLYFCFRQRNSPH